MVGEMRENEWRGKCSSKERTKERNSWSGDRLPVVGLVRTAPAPLSCDPGCGSIPPDCYEIPRKSCCLVKEVDEVSEVRGVRGMGKMGEM